MQIVESGTPINLTDDGVVSLVAGTLLGFYVNSTNAGTIIVRNGTSASGTAVTGTITPAIGYHALNMYLPGGCYVTVAGTALDVTLFFAAG